MSNRTTTSIITALFSLLIIGVAGLVLKPRLTDLNQAYDYITDQMFGDVSVLTKPDMESDLKLKEPGPGETRKRLMSIDPGARLEAIKAIEEKSDPQFVPQLIKLLNDTTSVEDKNTRANSQISEAAKTALIKLTKDNIIREPGNMATFIPVFQAGLQGSHAEKIGIIDILSALREPVAYPLLKQMSENRDRSQIALRASDAIRSLIPKSVTANDYFVVTSRRIEFMYLLMFVGVMMGLAAVAGLLKLKSAKFAVLCVLALVLNVGLGLLVHAELERGAITENSLHNALQSENLSALRAMSYSDNTLYPGDSFFAQNLVQSPSVNTFKVLIAIPEIEPDDEGYFKTNFQIRSRWIMARILMLNLGQPALETIIDSSDEDVIMSVIETFERLQIQNDHIKCYLERLSEDDKPEKVRNAAGKTLSNIKGRRLWPL